MYGCSALLAVQRMQFPIVGHGAVGTRSACYVRLRDSEEGAAAAEESRAGEMRSHADRHLHACTDSRRVAAARRGEGGKRKAESATVPAISRVGLVLARACAANISHHTQTRTPPSTGHPNAAIL
jgi:hypothetical protein